MTPELMLSMIIWWSFRKTIAVSWLRHFSLTAAREASRLILLLIRWQFGFCIVCWNICGKGYQNDGIKEKGKMEP